MILKKGTRMYSILQHKCPRCHEGDLYKSGPYNLSHFSEMPERCDHCGQFFKLEPSFYTGAMYVSYALQVALLTTVFVALRVLFDPSWTTYIVTTIAAAVLLFPVTFRLSRAIYINFFVSFDPQYQQVKVQS